MKINTRMYDLFRATVDVLLITVVGALASSTDVKARRSESLTRLADSVQESEIPRPGSGRAAVITLDAAVQTVEIGGRQAPLMELLRSKEAPDRVVLRLKGASWREVATLIKSRDLHFVVETDP
jgi:hypothetical protein